MSDTPRSTLRRRLFAFLTAGIGGAVAAAISFAMTVYEAANPDVIPTVAVGEPVDTGRWTVTFREARTGAAPPTGVKPYEPSSVVVMAPCLFEPGASFNVRHAQVAPSPFTICDSAGRLGLAS